MEKVVIQRYCDGTWGLEHERVRLVLPGRVLNCATEEKAWELAVALGYEPVSKVTLEDVESACREFVSACDAVRAAAEPGLTAREGIFNKLAYLCSRLREQGK